MLLDRPVCARLMLLGSVLLALISSAATHSSVSELIRPIAADLASDPTSCAALDSHWRDLEDPISLYRSQIGAVYLRKAGSKSHQDLSLGSASIYLFEAGGTLVQGSGRWPSTGPRLALPQGGYFEVGLKLHDTRRVPLLCVQLARVRSLRGSGFEVVAVQSRTHNVQARTRSFADMSPASVLEEMAASAALPLVLQHQTPDVVRSQTLQNRQPDWLFMRGLATANALSLTLDAGGTLRLRDSLFSTAEAFRPRSWREMSFPEMVEAIAAEQGLALENTTTRDWPSQPLVTQRLPDWPFLAAIARQQRVDLYLQGDQLRVANAVIPPRPRPRRRPQARASKSVDRLSHRIDLRAGAVRVATLTRGAARAKGRAPGPAIEAQRLLLTLPGKPSPSLPDLVSQLASAQVIDRRLTARLAALRSPSATPLERFLLELAELYRPSLRQHYRLNPKALQTAESELGAARRPVGNPRQPKP